jgi:hypothetical protein
MGEVDLWKRVQWIIEAAKGVAPTQQGANRIEEIQLYSSYAEPGYTDPECGIIATGNWNTITEYNRETRESKVVDATISRVVKLFEKLGVEMEWSDEWSDCGECYRIVRCSPDSYGWRPSYIVCDGELLCLDCIDGAEHLLNLEGNENSFNQIESIDFEEHGYLLIEDGFRHGMHYGMDASPQNIAKMLREISVERFVFNQEEQSQFYIAFSVWLHEDEKHLLEAAKIALETGGTDGPSVAAAMERGLQEASRQADELRAKGENGVIYSKIGPDGAQTRIVSEEEFIGGIKK